jgi:hypothetical protein
VLKTGNLLKTRQSQNAQTGKYAPNWHITGTQHLRGDLRRALSLFLDRVGCFILTFLLVLPRAYSFTPAAMTSQDGYLNGAAQNTFLDQADPAYTKKFS